MSSITPAIGRKVWFWQGDINFGDAAYIVESESQPFDAEICFVHNETTVNVSFRDHVGNVSTAIGVTLRDPAPGDQQGIGPVCTWMPWQIANASAPSPTPGP